eukprot:TRINITY_DN73095_c0_g1_i1.p2 TRINITY_DN73095_c0_g1~~TRINITY_DN73095_c0_g1_i1.p2  ORF type:complete len:153 (+),score=7.05 TRINITY_DN73095_c0_g1_i1:65-523(+)
MSVYKKFLGQTMVYGISTIFSRLFNFILTPVYTGVFAPGVYGVFTKMFSYVSIINPILAFGMETTFFRYLNKHEDRKQEVYNNSFFGNRFYINPVFNHRINFFRLPGQVYFGWKYRRIGRPKIFCALLRMDFICRCHQCNSIRQIKGRWKAI